MTGTPSLITHAPSKTETAISDEQKPRPRETRSVSIVTVESQV